MDAANFIPKRGEPIISIPKRRTELLWKGYFLLQRTLYLYVSTTAASPVISLPDSIEHKKIFQIQLFLNN